jgi:hypothetical protein
MYTHSPNKLKTFEQTLSARKLMTAVSWDRKRVLMMIILGTRDHNNA